MQKGFTGGLPKLSKKIKCVCYARFGNSSQLEIEKKKSALKDYANTHNLEIEKIEAEHLSGLKRSAILNQFIEDKNIKTILTPTISCLTRDIKLLLDIQEQAKRHNTKIISIDGSCEENTDTKNLLSKYF